MISLILGSFSVAFATEVNQETLYPLIKTNTTYYSYRYNGNSTSIARNTGVADTIGYFLQNLTETNYHLYSVLDGVEGYIDGIEGLLTTINNKLPASTWYTNITSYLDGVEGYIDGIEGSLTTINNKLPASTWYSNITSYLDGVEGYIDGIEGSLHNIDLNTDGLEGYVDGIESKLDTINNSIQSNSNRTAIGNIETYTHNVQYMLDGSSSGIYTLVDSLGDTLTYINSSIGTGGAGNSVLDKLSGVLSNQNSINNNLGYWNGVDNTSIAEIAYNIANNTSVLPVTNEILTSISAINNAINLETTGIHLDTNAIHTDTTGIHSDTTGIHADTSELIDKVVSFNSDFNSIDWVEYSGYVGMKKESSDSDYLSSNIIGSHFYVYFNTVSNQSIYRLHLPLIIYNAYGYDLNLDFYLVNSSGKLYSINDYILSYSFDKTGMNLFFEIPYQYPYNTMTNCIYINNKTGWNLAYTNGGSKRTYYLDERTSDFYSVSDNILLKNIYKLFIQAKEMFFDDEALQAKKDNASQTTAVLTGFTGSGQASATANDYGSLSTGVSDVKGGMNTNVSATNAFGIFNNSGGYGFWSNDTLQELNQSRTVNRSSSKSNDPTRYEYYNNRLEYLLNAMGGEKK